MTGQALVSTGTHWSLMFFIQAIGVGIAYFMLGRASLLVAVAVSTYYRKGYLEHILDKRIASFDAEGNSAGALTSRLSDDPHRVEALIQSVATSLSDSRKSHQKPPKRLLYFQENLAPF